MAGKPFEVELEALYKAQIRMVRKKLAEIAEEEATDVVVNPEVYARRRELTSYINYYRIALEKLRRYGPEYTGHEVEERWLINLSDIERKVFLEHFCQRKSFAQITEDSRIPEPHKVYVRAYRKVIASIQEG